VAPQRIHESLLRSVSPDYLDLPWELPLEEWEGHCNRLESVPRGVGRHPVVFVNYEGNLFALKELPDDLAKYEHEVLVQMEELRLPVVRSVGWFIPTSNLNPRSILITRHLARSLPYHILFESGNSPQDRERLLDAMAGLLVQLHLAGVFWGDCSLSNTLFRRDTGSLQAYLVDAETAEIENALSEGRRQYDLDIMEENVEGALADLAAMRGEPAEPGGDVGSYIRSRYDSLWAEINREEVLDPSEGWKIQQRIRALNDLGFSVREVSMREGESGLRVRAIVADRHYHQDMFNSLTGLDAEELQAQQLLNEIQEHSISMSEQYKRSVPLSAAAFHWQMEVYQPLLSQLKETSYPGEGEIELYCELLEHKWYLSERAQRDVGHDKALEDFKKLRSKK